MGELVLMFEAVGVDKKRSKITTELFKNKLKIVLNQ